MEVSVRKRTETNGRSKAQSSDSTPRRSSEYGSEYSRWDDDSSNRPNSLLPFTSYGYVGASIGESHLDLGSCAPGLICDNQGDAYKVFAGGKLVDRRDDANLYSVGLVYKF